MSVFEVMLVVTAVVVNRTGKRVGRWGLQSAASVYFINICVAIAKELGMYDGMVCWVRFRPSSASWAVVFLLLQQKTLVFTDAMTRWLEGRGVYEESSLFVRTLFVPRMCSFFSLHSPLFYPLAENTLGGCWLLCFHGFYGVV